MRIKSLFLLTISLAPVSLLVDIHSVSAQLCPGPLCGIIGSGGTYGDNWYPGPYSSLHLAERKLKRLLGEAERTQDLNRQAEVHRALGDVYTIRGWLDLASIHLNNAKTLYETLGNSQRSNEVQLQLQQLQLQQLQLQQLQPQQLQLQQLQLQQLQLQQR